MWNRLLWKLFTKHAPGSLSLRAIAISHTTTKTRLHSLKPEAKSTSFDGGCYMILIHVLLQWKHFKCGIIPKNVWQGIYIGTLDLTLPWLYLLKFICILDLIFYFLNFKKLLYKLNLREYSLLEKKKYTSTSFVLFIIHSSFIAFNMSDIPR